MYICICKSMVKSIKENTSEASLLLFSLIMLKKMICMRTRGFGLQLRGCGERLVIYSSTLTLCARTESSRKKTSYLSSFL